MNKGIWGVVVLVVVVIVGAVIVRKQQSESVSTGGATTQASTLTIAVIPKGTTPFVLEVGAGWGGAGG